VNEVAFITTDGNRISMGAGPVTFHVGDGLSFTTTEGTYVSGDVYSVTSAMRRTSDGRRYPGEGNRVARRTAAKGRRRTS
jgi:hypothetical protein